MIQLNPKFSIIIVTYNSGQYLTDCIAAVQPIKAIVQLIKTDVPVDEPVDGHVAPLERMDEARNVANRHATSHIAPQHRFLVTHQIGMFEAELCANW